MSTPRHEPLMPPETIWLQIGEDEPGAENKSFSEFRDEVTWCWHKINDNDLEYRLVAEGVAAPLEPSPADFYESRYMTVENAPHFGIEHFRFAEAYAAAASKNPLIRSDTKIVYGYAYAKEGELVCEVSGRAWYDTACILRNRLEAAEKEIAALRETK